MGLGTYTDLKQAIADHLDQDLTVEIDDFIDLVEARNKQEIQLSDRIIPPVLIRDMLSRSSLTVNARFVSLPSGFLVGETLRLLTNPVTVLTEVNLHEMNRVRKETTGTPEFYTIHEQIEFDVTPSESFSGEIVFYQEVTALSSSNETNAILTAAPNIYLYGALEAAAPFLLNDERIATWRGFYLEARAGLSGVDRRARNIGPLVSRIIGARP